MNMSVSPNPTSDTTANNNNNNNNNNSVDDNVRGEAPACSTTCSSATHNTNTNTNTMTSDGTSTNRSRKKPPLPVNRTPELVILVRECQSSHMPIDICYQCFGDPAKGNPVILLVCGLNMQLLAWDEDFCEDLARAGFFVIRYDNRDIGCSTKIEERGSVVGPRLLLPNKWASMLGEKLPYTLDDMAKDGLALLDALHIDHAHVIGISMGGMIAQLMSLLAPHRILSLTSIMSTTNEPDLPDPQPWVKLHMLRRPPKNCSLDELLKFRADSLKHLLKYALPVDDAYLRKRYLMSLSRSSYGAGLLRQAAAVRRCPGRDQRLRTLPIPALVVHGAQDLVVPPIHGYRTASVIPHARMLVLKSMGHYFHPAFFHTVVVAFADMASTTSGPPAVSPTRFSPLQRAPSFPTMIDPEMEIEEQQEVLMASMAALFDTVVASPVTRTGMAAALSVHVAVPKGSDPSVPEAVLVDLHEQEVPEEDVVMPYIPGKPSTWNTIADAVAAAEKNRNGSSDNNDNKNDNNNNNTRRPIQIVGVRVESYLSRLKESPKKECVSPSKSTNQAASEKEKMASTSSVGGMSTTVTAATNLAATSLTSPTTAPVESPTTMTFPTTASADQVVATIFPPGVPHDMGSLPESIVSPTTQNYA